MKNLNQKHFSQNHFSLFFQTLQKHQSSVNFRAQNFFLIDVKTLVRSENKLSKNLLKTIKRKPNL